MGVLVRASVDPGPHPARRWAAAPKGYFPALRNTEPMSYYSSPLGEERAAIHMQAAWRGKCSRRLSSAMQMEVGLPEAEKVLLR